MSLPNDKIASSNEYLTVQATIAKAEQPPAILCALMRLFESYRAARKIGWSRPWNKYGVTTFQSFSLRFPGDSLVRKGACSAIIKQWGTALSPSASAFVESLVEDDAGMGFVFLHDIVDRGHTYEGFTLSLGRKAHGKPRHRDRLDLIFERPVNNGRVSDNTRVRVYVDPFTGPGDPAFSDCIESTSIDEELNALEHDLLALFSLWMNDAERDWDHWSSRYVEYFGARKEVPRGSRLPAINNRVAA